MREGGWDRILLYCGLALIFVLMCLIASTQCDLPTGPPIVVLLSAAPACVAVTRLARRS